MNTRELIEEIEFIELTLQVQFPTAYRTFLAERGSAIIGGFKIFGIPTEAVPTSVLETTAVLREKRRDLPESLIAISITRGEALCLDTERGTEEDCPLVAVSVIEENEPLTVADSFNGFVEDRTERARRFREAYQRVARRRNETEEWRGMKYGIRKRQLLPRPQDWHPIVSEIQDRIVGLAALRHNPVLQCLEVDEFYAIDHPAYGPGAAIRNLAMIIFTFARDFSGALNVAFTDERKDGKSNFFRPSRPVPERLIELGRQYGVTFRDATKGRIHHSEGVELYFAILEFPQHSSAVVKQLEDAGYLSRELIAEVIATGIWSREEVLWVLENATCPEAVLFGTTLPEQRVLHADALQYGRSALLAKRFQHVVITEITDGFSSEEREVPECVLEPKDGFWMLRSAIPFDVPWIIEKGESVRIEAHENILLLSRPRVIGGSQENEAWLKEQIALLEEEKRRCDARIACLIVNYEFFSRDFGQDPEHVKALAQTAAQEGVYVVIPYDRCDQLDLEVEEKMRRARRLRRLSVRAAPLALRVITVKKQQWNIKKKFGHVARNAYDYGRLIANKVNIKRYRNDFIITCLAVERMALQDAAQAEVVQVSGEESLAVIGALDDEYGIGRSFVMPDEMKNFIKKVPRKLRKQLTKTNGGIVVVGVPYQKVHMPVVAAQMPKVQYDIPEDILKKIYDSVEEKLANGSYVSRDTQIRSVDYQIQTALHNGMPLAVSHIQPQVFVETVREYIYQPTVTKHREETRYRKQTRYRTERVAKPFWGRVLSKIKGDQPFNEIRVPYKKSVPYKTTVSYEHPLVDPVYIRIVYSDGSEGKSFPLFSLRKCIAKGQFYEFPAQLVSLRHMLADYATIMSIIRNVEIQRRETEAEQEEFAFQEVYKFVSVLLQMIQGKISVEEAEERTGIAFRILWSMEQLEQKVPMDGLSLHLFQSTGLEPAVVGAYRAVVQLLQEFRGELEVVPRIYCPDSTLQEEFNSVARSAPLDREAKKRIVSAMYRAAETWY